MTPTVLRKRRNKLKISQFLLAKLSKVSKFRLQQYENSYDVLKDKELIRIEKVLKKRSITK